MNIGSREEGRGDKEEGSDVGLGKEEDSIHESFLRPPESTLRPIYLRTIERKEGGQTDGAQTRKESQTLTRATKSVGGGRSCNNARWLRVDDIGDERWVDSWLKESTPSSGMKSYLIVASVDLLLIQHPCQFNL